MYGSSARRRPGPGAFSHSAPPAGDRSAEPETRGGGSGGRNDRLDEDGDAMQRWPMGACVGSFMVGLRWAARNELN